MDGVINFLIQPYLEATWLDITIELLAVFFGIWSVYLAKKEHIGVFPTGIISTGIYVYICVQYNLFGDVLINIYYTIMSLYGWWMWKNMGNVKSLKISVLNKNDILKSIGIFIVTILIVASIYLYFGKYKVWIDFADTFTTGVFFVAMWMMANKKIEHWIAWIAGNIISVPLYLYKGLGFTAIQFSIFLGLAFLGYIDWKKSIKLLKE